MDLLLTWNITGNYFTIKDAFQLHEKSSSFVLLLHHGWPFSDVVKCESIISNLVSFLNQLYWWIVKPGKRNEWWEVKELRQIRKLISYRVCCIRIRMRVFHFSMPIKSPSVSMYQCSCQHYTNQEVNPPFHSHSTKFNALYHFFSISVPHPLTYFCFTLFPVLSCTVIRVNNQ